MKYARQEANSCVVSLTCRILKSQEQRIDWWLPGAEGWGIWGDTGQNIQSFNHKNE